MASAEAAFCQAALGLGTAHGHAESEALLLSLRGSPHGIDLALSVLSASSAAVLAISLSDRQRQLVRYHASLVLRDAAIRQYSHARCAQLIERCLELAVQQPHSHQNNSEADALLQTAAALYKRSYLDSKDGGGGGGGMLEWALKRLSMAQEEQERWHGARLVLFVVWEFSISTGRTTALGQAMDFHLRCARHFHDAWLRAVFVQCAQAAFSSPQDGATLCTLLDVLECVLNWPFDMFGDNASSSSSSWQHQRINTASSLFATRRIDPGPQWSFLLEPGFAHALYGLLTAPTTGGSAAGVRTRVRQLLLLIGCLSGSVFGSAADEAQAQHSLRLCALGVHLSAAASADDMLEGCQLVSRALTMPRLDMLPALAEQAAHQLVPLTLHVSHKCLVVCAEQRTPYARTQWGEALTSLLTVWVLLSTRSSELSPALRQAIAAVFASVVDTKTRAAPIECVLDEDEDGGGGGDRGEEEDEEEDDDKDEFMRDLASLARVDMPSALQLVSGYLSDDQAASSLSFEARCETLAFHAELLAVILADDDDDAACSSGEAVDLPLALTQQQSSAAAAAASLLLLRVFQRETAPDALFRVSPLLSETLLRAVRVWAATYLYVAAAADDAAATDYQRRPAELAQFALSSSSSSSSSSSGADILHTLVHAACVLLQHFGAEERVGRASVALLRTLAARGSPSFVAVHSCGAWHALFQAHLASVSSPTLAWAPLHLVSAAAHGELVGVLASTCRDAHEYDEYIFAPLARRMSSSFSSTDAVRVGEMFRGIARCEVQEGLAYRVRESIAGSLKGLLQLCRVGGGGGGQNLDVLLSVLSVFADFCEAHLSVCEQALLPEIYSTCAVLVQLFVASFPAAAAGASSKKKEDDDEELDFKADALSKVIKVLIALSDRNFLDFSGPAASSTADSDDDPSAIVLLGVSAILPLVDGDMLQLGTVAACFFDLVCGMCRLRPEFVSGGGSALFASIRSALGFGVRHHDAKIQRGCLESIASLCPVLASDGDDGGSLVAQQWQCDLLELITASHADMVGSTLDCAACALLASVQRSPDAFPLAANAVCARALSQRRQGPLIDPAAEDQRLRALGDALQHEIGRLFRGVQQLNSSSSSSSSSRADRKQFCSNVQEYVRAVRGFVLVM